MSKFGWSYPPGAASDPNAPYNQNGPYTCEVCLCDAEVDCECIECPVCGAYGDPKCYAEGHDMRGSVEFSDEVASRIRADGCRWKNGFFYLVLAPDVVVGRIGRATLMAIWDLIDRQIDMLYEIEFEEAEAKRDHYRDEDVKMDLLGDKWRH